MRRVAWVIAVAGLLAVGARGAEPVRVDARNPAYLSWRGKTLVLITSAEHYGAVLNLDFDYRKYLETLQRDGMNYTRLFAGSYVEPVGAFGIERNTLAPKPGRFIAPWARSDQAGYAGGGNKFDLSRWDEAYLTRLKDFIAEAGRRGVIVELTLFCSTYGDAQWKVHPLNPANNVNATDCADFRKLHTLDNGNVLAHQEKLARHLVRELAGFDNLFFEVQNEPWADNHDLGEVIWPQWVERKGWPNRVEIPKAAAVAWQAKIAAAIEEEQSKRPAAERHLVAQNVANFRLAVREEDLFPNAGLVNFHYALPEAARWNRHLRRPIVCDETGFLGPDPAPYRREAWRFILSGGAGYNNLDYSFAVGKEDGTDRQPKSPGTGGPELRKQLRAMSEFIHGFDVAAMRPDHEAVLASPGAASWCLSEPGRQYAVYLEGRPPRSLTLALPRGVYRVRWVETVTCTRHEAEVFDTSGPQVTLRVPPFEEGIGLSVTREQP